MLKDVCGGELHYRRPIGFKSEVCAEDRESAGLSGVGASWSRLLNMDPAPQAAHSSVVELNTCLTSKEACDSGPPDSYPVVGSSPCTPKPAKSGWAPVMEFTAADIFQHSPFGNVLNSLKSLSLSGDSWPNYVRLEWEAGDEEIRYPPTTHLIATVDDLTDVLNFDSEHIDGIDDDAG